jgi:type VI secretion system secreted protein Hcp
MKLKSLLFSLIAGLGLTAGTHAHAAAYIKFDGVDGESTDARHKNWSDLQSVSFGIKVETTTGAGGSTRRAVAGEVQCVKVLDKSSPLLMRALTLGEIIPILTIEFTRSTAAGDEPYLKYELENILISSYSISPGGGGSGEGEQAPTETLSLNYEKITVTYTERDEAGQVKGTVAYTWSVEEGTN